MPSSTKSFNKGSVVGIEIYANDVIVRRQGRAGGQVDRKPRGEINMFSDNARKRLAFVASNTQVDFVSMITLTYPDDYPADGKMVKRHLYRFLAWLRAQSEGINYLWWLEFQKRGAPHFHILIDRQPIQFGSTWPVFQVSVARTWNDIVDGGYDHLRVGTRSERLRSPEGGRHYCVKYAQKMSQKAVPALYRNVGRFYGYTRPVKPKAIMSVATSWQSLRNLLGDWSYLPDKEDDLYKVLYNTSGVVAPKVIQSELPMFDIG